MNVSNVVESMAVRNMGEHVRMVIVCITSGA